MPKSMNIEPAQAHADNIASGVVAAIGFIVAWLEPSKLLILLTIGLTAVKLFHSIILLRRDMRESPAVIRSDDDADIG